MNRIVSLVLPSILAVSIAGTASSQTKEPPKDAKPATPNAAATAPVPASPAAVRAVAATADEAEVKRLMGTVPGFVSYTAIRSGDGGITVTVCEDKTGTDESSRRAAEWVKENISAAANPPEMTEGGTVAHFGS